MGNKLELFKAWMRLAALIGVLMAVHALVTPGDQPVFSMCGGALSSVGVMLGWYDFDKAFK